MDGSNDHPHGTTRRRRVRPSSDAQQEESTERQTERESQLQSMSTTRNDTTADSSVEKLPATASVRHNSHSLDGYQLTLLIPKPAWARYDVGPFLVLYAACLWIDQQHLAEGNTIASGASRWLTWAYWVALPATLLLHLTVALWQQWHVKFECWVGYNRVSAVTGGVPSASDHSNIMTHCLVQAPRVGTQSAAAAIVPTTRDSTLTLVVNFQDVVFRASLDPAVDDIMDTLWTSPPQASTRRTNTPNQVATNPYRSSSSSVSSVSSLIVFQKLRYPIHFPVSFYTNDWKGHVSLQSVRQAHALYGPNATVIQLPTFSQLLGQQLLAPFFLFQLFCVLLWSLDEYWYYAIFTLMALVMFESTVAYNRRQALQRLRGTLRHPTPMWVYRHSQWIRIRTDELVPGDIVSLSTQASYRATSSGAMTPCHVPADIVLLPSDGGCSAVVDEALLTGESIPQLKVPLTTTATSSTNTPQLDVESEHKASVLFGGTVLVSLDHEDGSSDASENGGDKKNTSRIEPPPDSGLVGFTLRTGFDTAQGSLLRTMAHSSQKAADGIHTQDTFVFVAMLLCCAVASALMVLREGWYDETRNKFRLVLHVVIIVTSVVPPELPMELSLAVTNSVADLMKRCHVFCTEPFRIPWAGQVNVCCFDKTGTLTSDEMQLQGVVQWKSDINNVLEPTTTRTELIHPGEQDLPWSTLRVMAACHSLAVAQGGIRVGESSDSNLVGNPLERAVLRETGYRLRSSDVVVSRMQPTDERPQRVRIHRRFAFTSRLKRMTTLVTEDDGSKTVWGLIKGAPETIKSFLKPESVPWNYDELYLSHMGRGQRVLAMGYRHFGSKSIGDLKDTGRDEIERDFIFTGFLILDCPLKHDSKAVILALRKSGHDTVMITGDAVLTAVEVARQVGIIASKKAMIYELCERDDMADGLVASSPLNGFWFVPIPGSTRERTGLAMNIPASSSCLPGLKDMVEKREASFCVSGSVLTKLAAAAVRSQDQQSRGRLNARPVDEKSLMLHSAAQNILKDVVPIVSVFARHAPHHKEAVVAAFNLGDKHTLMCGDGTNDVGALKRAHVGISIISAPELEAKQRKATAVLTDLESAAKRERRTPKEGRKAELQSSRKKRASTLESTLRQLQEAQDELDHVELGDASVASPFTSRTMSIRCCQDVLQQGRCTLVTMLQIYKILGVNCLVNALVLTKLHMHGVKQGDRQLTVLGVAVAALFFFVTRGKPLPKLSPRRPPPSVLCRQALVSLVGQFAVHFFAIMLATDVALAFVDPYDPSMIPDGAFNPNVLNTCTFLLTMVATVSSFVVNYRGRPFVEDFCDNKLLLRSVQFCFGSLFVCVFEVFPPLNDLLQLSPFPDDESISGADVTHDEFLTGIALAGGLTGLVRGVGFPTTIAFLMTADVVVAYAVEKTVLWTFGG